MKILLQKQLDGTEWLQCHRPDGSVLREQVQVGSAYHDLAHLVVERRLGIREGIWGKIADGFSLTEYNRSNEERAFAITPEGYRAEFLSTLVQSAVGTGSISPAYIELLRDASLANGIPFPELPEADLLASMIDEATALTRQWGAVPSGGSMEIHF